MALDKQFKVKDTINVGVSGLFGSGIRIGDGSTYPSPVPAIDAWGPIVSGGRDLSMFIGDGIDQIRETAYAGGTVTGDGTKTLLALALEDDIQSRQLPAGTDKNGAAFTSFTQVPANAAEIVIPSEYLPEKQGTIQYQTQENSSSVYDAQSDTWGSNNVWSTVEVLGLQGYDSPTFANLTLSGTGFGDGSVSTLSASNELIIDPRNDGDILGKVRIKGDFYVDGTTTTINSTNVSLSDAVIALGYGENNFLDNDTKVPAGGVGIQAGSIANATILYTGANGWTINGNELTSLVDFNVGTTGGDKFSVISSSGNVSTKGTLHVDGATTIDDSLTLSGALTVKSSGADGVAMFAVDQTGSAALSGSLTIAGGAADEGFIYNSSTYQTTVSSINVEDLTNNEIVLAGTSGELEGDSNFRFDGTNLDIGALNAEKFSVAVATGNTNVSGALLLGGGFTMESSAGVERAKIDTSGNLTVDGNTTLSGDLAVAADQTGASAGATNFKVTQAGALTVSGASKFGDDVLVDAGGKEAIKIVATTGAVSIAGTTTLSGDLTVKTDAGVEQFGVSKATGNVAVSGTAAIKGAVTVDNSITIAGASKQTESIDSTHFTLTDVFSGSSGAEGVAMAVPVATFTVTNLNTAKYIVTIGEPGGADKTAIEVLCVSNGSEVNGTAFGQVEIGTEQLFDLEVGVASGNVSISVSGTTESTPVTIQGTAHYDSH